MDRIIYEGGVEVGALVDKTLRARFQNSGAAYRQKVRDVVERLSKAKAISDFNEIVGLLPVALSVDESTSKRTAFMAALFTGHITAGEAGAVIAWGICLGS